MTPDVKNVPKPLSQTSLVNTFLVHHKETLPMSLKLDKTKKILCSLPEYVECPTNAGKYIETMRHSTISNIAAIEDICDNCIDAEASVVNITTEWKKV